tara:strand:+ start:524 stop:628 length:105 start_codon:yes stop_codon:yes gene_type:complete
MPLFKNTYGDKTFSNPREIQYLQKLDLFIIQKIN